MLTYIAINVRVPGIVEVWHGDSPDCRRDSFLDAVDWDCSGYQLSSLTRLFRDKLLMLSGLVLD